ncbi:MAG: 4-hydroxyphenylpyruvate dioxygenase [Bacteroidetes bacterium QH_2_67_10]|nr:MAG: 4-hydroxyphenylpyruvate dioxygenase [Bacteroidetes bacterium QH_2_67_10]
MADPVAPAPTEHDPSGNDAHESAFTEESRVDATSAEDFLPINGTDHLQFYVGNARQAAFYYAHYFGFEMAGYRGPETGHPGVASYLLRQNDIRFVLTTGLGPDTESVRHQQEHGDGVKDIAIEVDDARSAFAETTRRGATPVREPEVLEDDDGRIVRSAIATYGDTIHSFIERTDYDGLFLPGFEPYENEHLAPQPAGLEWVDHCVGNVHLGDMETYVNYYAETMGFKNMLHFTDQDISTEYSALMSKVMSNGDEIIKFPINEPAKGEKKSQIEEYLDFYRGAGVQHIALLTNDIISTVRDLRGRGVEFLETPDAYFDMLPERVGEIDEDIEVLRDLSIQVDRDPDGYLLQIFTKPQQDRPTLFYEVIQRKGARTFGAGNFKALFEAIEREQAKRGNL